MKKLLNTLYVLTPESYLFCRNENICIKLGGEEKLAVPALTIDAIVCFGQMTVSTPLLAFCGEHGISITFLTQSGAFQGRFYGPVSGNVLLRKKQYESLNDPAFRCRYVRDELYAKFRNSKMVLLRHARNVETEGSGAPLYEAAQKLSEAAETLSDCDTVDSMRGVEGAAASVYFAQFDEMLRGNPNGFHFKTRSRRPPRNEVNAVLSFTYMLLTREVQSALETVGLDPAAGCLHTLRPGRASFALDLMEELRAPLADRLALSLVNRRQVRAGDFRAMDGGAVLLTDAARKLVLTAWQERKQEERQHAFLGEKAPFGLVPWLQAQMLARHLRGDLDAYPPWFWK